MIDPPREAVKDAIAAAKAAHIKIIVITWDYAKTASAIGEKVWLWSPEYPIRTYTWNDLARMSDVKLASHLQYPWSLIFSRVSPEDKVRIVTHCKTLWHIVAVTWDGVNDAPALKTAHIGVAMGKTWTDVAKEAADIILLDDSFSSLVAAISQWRVIFQNIQKNILSCITTNRAELFAVLLWIAWTVFTWAQIAITAVQILAIDLLWEMWPLAALSQDPPAKWIMKSSPRNISNHIIHRNAMKDMVISWLIIWICGYVWFLLITSGEDSSWILHMQGQTVMYLSIILCQYVNIFSRRIPDNNFFSAYLWSNKKLLIAMWASLLVIIGIVYIPFFNIWFGFAPLPVLWWVYAVCWAMVYWTWRYRVQGSGKQYFQRA
jgi:Ca2+-transporting ATPase